MTDTINFLSTSPVRIEESLNGLYGDSTKLQISGTMLTEGISRNGNLYSIEELQNIASQASGKPIYFGTMSGISPNTGLFTKNLHADVADNLVGRIRNAYVTLRDGKKLIQFFGEVWNTSKFPDLVKRVKSGFGISIGGFVQEAKYILNDVGRKLLKIKNLLLDHICLIEPSVVRGQDDAKVETVKVQETMIFTHNNKMLTDKMLKAIVTALYKEGVFDE
jgi:hypothetical protein